MNRFEFPRQNEQGTNKAENKVEEEIGATHMAIPAQTKDGDDREQTRDSKCHQMKKRIELAMKLKIARRMRYTRGSMEMGGRKLDIGSSNLAYLEKLHNINFVKEIKRIYRDVKHEKSSVRVLDIGTARSTILAELKKELGKRIECHSIDVRRYPKQKGVVSHVGHIEALRRFLPNLNFDLIIDNRGGMLYAWINKLHWMRC